MRSLRIGKMFYNLRQHTVAFAWRRLYNRAFTRKLSLTLAGLLLSGIGLWGTGLDSYAQQDQVVTASSILTRLREEREDVHISKPQSSPDGRYTALTVVPLGTETVSWARTHLYDTTTSSLRYTFAGHTARWLQETIDGDPLLQVTTVDRSAVIYIIGRTIRPLPFAQRESVAAISQRKAYEPSLITDVFTEAPPYPTTIRVAHHPSNGCRDVAEWQIDVIPFEEYIARVVPAETPAGWPLDALAAQAIAVRTYAWHQILAQRAEYDVTDWANFQMMCDARYPNSDAAVAMTAGQYLAATDHVLNGTAALPISAMYSAENGHPTLTNSTVNYLQSVPDRFALGRTRWGHGYGLSQWGTYRRAQAGHSYRQILGHYYSNVYLVNGLVGNLGTSAPMGVILGGEPDEQLASDAITLNAMIHPALTPRFVITASHGLTAPVTIDANHLNWRPPHPLTHGTALTATLWLDGQWQDERSWQVDHNAPASLYEQITAQPATLYLPTVITQPVTTILLPMRADIPLLAHDMAWEGEALLHTVNSGTILADAQAANGVAWTADPARHSAGIWYGPYTTAVAPGHSYRALFWLRTPVRDEIRGTVTQAIPVASLDVTDDEGRTPLGLRDLQISDFAIGDAYTPIAVDFHLFAPPTGLEFRVAWAGQVPLTLDRVEIWQLPDHIVTDKEAQKSARVQWDVRGQPLAAPLHVRYTDRAGNLGEVTRQTLTLLDATPPVFETIAIPAQANPTLISSTLASSTTDPILITPAGTMTVTATVSDSFSGLALDRVQATLTDDDLLLPLPLSTVAGATPWQASTLTTIVPALGTLPFATERYTLTITAYDQAGNRADVHQQFIVDNTLVTDTRAPTVTVGLPQPQIEVWHLEPMTISLWATDSGSGVATLAYTLTKYVDGAQIENEILSSETIHGDSATVPVQQAGAYMLTAQAVDRAGNHAALSSRTLFLDLAAPTVIVSQSTVDSSTVHLSWQSTDDGSGVAHVEMQMRQGTQAWEEALRDQVEPTAGTDISIDPEQSTAIRMRAQDRVGRWSEWVEMHLWIATDWVYLPLVQNNNGGNR